MRAPRVAALLALALVLGVLHTWPHRYGLVNLDAVSYLDIADAWRTTGWRTAVNAYWSPAYSWILAVAMWAVRPAPAHEYLLLHAINLLLYGIALAACVWFLRELCADAGSTDDESSPLFSGAQLTTVCLLFFTWIAITQIVVWMESPDLLVSIVTLSAAALTLRLRRHPSAVTGASLGAVLGVGYLCKAAMLPLAAVYLPMATLAAPVRRGRVCASAAVLLAMIAGPWVAALSMTKGRVTWGEAGKLNYLWCVSRSAEWPVHWPAHWPVWDNGYGAAGAPVHGPEILQRDPAVYRYARGPLDAFRPTYAAWEDPSYFYDGLEPVPSVRDLLRRLKLSMSDYVTLLTINFYQHQFPNPQPALAGALAVAVLAVAGGWSIAWPVAVPAAAALVMYASVFVEPRYVGPAVFVLWACAFAAPRIDRSTAAARVRRAAYAVSCAAIAASLAWATVVECGAGWRHLLRGEPDVVNQPWHAASTIGAAGIPPGSSIAIAGDAQVASRWARLARVHIIAQLPKSDMPRFTADGDTAQRTVDALARSGAAFVLSEQRPPTPGWREVPGTQYWLYVLR